MATGCHISLPFASSEVNKWCQRFEICSKANELNDATMAPYAVRGKSATADEQKDYKTAMKQMVAKMAPNGLRFIGGLSSA